MRRICCLSLLLALLLSLPARSDVIWEPEDPFYQQNSQNCEYCNRVFLANGAPGYAEVRDAPDGGVTGRVGNGERVLVYYICQGWGYILNNDLSGWTSLGELSLVYDYISFAEEYGDRFVPYDPETAEPLLDAYLESGRTVLVFWPYPNARAFQRYDADGAELLEALKEHGLSQVFTDEEGYLWGFCSYLYGMRNFWILLNDPGAGDGVSIPEEGSTDAPGERIVSVREVPEPELHPAGEAPGGMAAALTAGVVLLSAGALWVFYGRKKRRS